MGGSVHVKQVNTCTGNMKERNLSTFTNIDIMVNKGALACTCIPGKKIYFQE